MADGVAGWAAEQPPHRLHKVWVKVPTYATPIDLIDGIHRARLQMRGVFDRRKRQDERWASVACGGFFWPRFNGGWSSVFVGVALLPQIHQLTFANALTSLVNLRVESLSAGSVYDDVYHHIYTAINSADGLSRCSSESTSTYFNEVDHHGGFKTLIFRRGFQA